MNPWLGWALAAAAIAAGWRAGGWPGVALAASALVFWLLLQFTRSLSVLRSAAQAPLGHVASAVMLHSTLRRGMRLPEIIKLTQSLGRRLAETPETYGWRDEGGSEVRIEFERGRCRRWVLHRPGIAAAATPAP